MEKLGLSPGGLVVHWGADPYCPECFGAGVVRSRFCPICINKTNELGRVWIMSIREILEGVKATCKTCEGLSEERCPGCNRRNALEEDRGIRRARIQYLNAHSHGSARMGNYETGYAALNRDIEEFREWASEVFEMACQVVEDVRIFEYEKPIPKVMKKFDLNGTLLKAILRTELMRRRSDVVFSQKLFPRPEYKPEPEIGPEWVYKEPPPAEFVEEMAGSWE